MKKAATATSKDGSDAAKGATSLPAVSPAASGLLATPQSRRIVYKVLWALILVAIGGYFRLLAVEETLVDQPIRADAQDYFLSAYNLAQHGIYSRSNAALVDPAAHPVPDAYRSPGLPLLIAPFMSAWPNAEAVVRNVQYVNVLLGLSAVLALYLAATAVLPAAAAVAVGMLAATSPHLISLTVYLLTETPAVLMVALLFLVAARDVPVKASRRAAYFAVLGALVGGLSLFRPAFLAFAPLIALAYRRRTVMLQALLYACLGAALVVAPWLIRNALDVPPGGPSLLAGTMLEGSYRGLIYGGDPATFPYGGRHDPHFAALATSTSSVLHEVLDKILADPGRMALWYLIEKPVYLFQWNNIDGIGDVFVYPVKATPFRSNGWFAWTHELQHMLYPLLLLLAVAGAILAWFDRIIGMSFWHEGLGQGQSRAHLLRLASLLLVFVYLVHIPFVVNTRYALPAFPAVYLLALFALTLAWRTVRQRLAPKAKRESDRPIPATRTRSQPRRLRA